MWSRWTFLILLALALTGAPFGMGRMMDTAHAAHGPQIHAAHQTGHSGHGQPQPDHPAKAVHFTLCAACVAALPQSPAPVTLAVLTGIVHSGPQTAITGIHALPPTPPPRA